MTLALEVLSSRIMTPYFGVSLYIWAAILSSTLAFMALGYWLGGRVSRGASAEALEARFLTTPLLSAIALGLSALAYPALLPMFVEIDLVAGSFLGAVLLLALPLATLSAMNPMLIALRIQSGADSGRAGEAAGDAGSGRIFFLSTVGSVAGVVATAFFVIPNVSNFRGVLMMAMILCAAVAIVVQLATSISPFAKRRITIACIMVLVGCAALSASKQAFLSALSPVSAQFDVRREYTSIFGNVKVVDFIGGESGEAEQRFLLQDGLVQNRTVLPSGDSATFYTYVLDAFAEVFAPDAKRALVLGLGAGIVPESLAARGMTVTAVEINPDITAAAREFFGFDDEGVEVVESDARTFVRSCEAGYDLVVVDLFIGDGVPDYLLSKEFFADLRACVRPGAAIAMNSPAERGEGGGPDPHIAATLASSFARVFYTQTETGNGFLAALAQEAAAPDPGSRAFGRNLARFLARQPARMRGSLRELVTAGRYLEESELAAAAAVSDDHNIFSVRFAVSDLARRRLMAGVMPPLVMTN